MNSDADTLLLSKGDRTKLKWYEYLSWKYEEIYNDLDELFLRYQYYLEDEEIECLIN